MERLAFYEIETIRRRATRRLWLAIGVTAVTTVMSCAVAAVAMMQPTPVIAFDGEGRVVRWTERRDLGMEGHRVWVEDFVGDFLERWIAVDSTRLEEDFGDALNMLAPQLREIVLREGEAAEYRSQFAGLFVRSHLVDVELRFGDLESSELIHFYAWGGLVIGPVGESVESSDVDAERFTRRWFLAKGILAKRPISNAVRRGLVIEHFTYDMTNSTAELETMKLKLMRDR